MKFLRFTDEAAWLTAAGDAGFMFNVPVYNNEGVETNIEEQLAAYTTTYAIDVVGVIPNLTGYHVNYVGNLPIGWEQYEVTPSTPPRS